MAEASCPTSPGWPSAAATGACARPSRRSRRSRGRASRPAQPGPPQHLRLPRPRSAQLPAAAVVDHIGSVDRVLKLGKLRIPLQRPAIRLLRKSKPWWTILGEHNVWSTIHPRPHHLPPMSSTAPARRHVHPTCSAPRGPSSCSRRGGDVPFRRAASGARSRLRRHLHRVDPGARQHLSRRQPPMDAADLDPGGRPASRGGASERRRARSSTSSRASSAAGSR